MRALLLILLSPTFVLSSDISESFGDINLQIQASEDPNFANYLQEEFEHRQKEKQAAIKYRNLRLQRDLQQKKIEKEFATSSRRQRAQEQLQQQDFEQKHEQIESREKQKYQKSAQEYSQKQRFQRALAAQKQLKIKNKVQSDLQRLPASYTKFKKARPRVKRKNRRF